MRSNVPVIAIAASLAAYMPWSKVDSVAAADLVAITPVKGCAELEKLDLSRGDAGPVRIDSAKEIVETTKTFCIVKGYIAPQINFEARLPLQAGPSATFSSAAEVTAAA
jgi:hypothetical protein